MAAAIALGVMAAPPPQERPHGPPAALHANCEPVPYPIEAALRYAQGVSRIRYVVDAAGHATAIEVASPSGATAAHRLLDAAAVAFLEGCRFDAQAPGAGAQRQMDYVWSIDDIGRDRWIMARAVETQEPPDIYPVMVSEATCGMPTWPAEVRAKVRADDVILRLDVDATGSVQRVVVLHSSGQAVIDDAIRSAAGHCQFQPAQRRGAAVAASTQMLYPWADGSARLGFLWSQTPNFRTASEEADYEARRAIHPGCPDAPAPEKDTGGEGRASFRLHYDAAGTLIDATLVSSSGSAQFDEDARKRFSTCGFRQLFGDEAPVEDRLVTYSHFRRVDKLACARVEYPQESEQRNETGTVTLKLRFDASGASLEPTLVESSGHPLLDRAAMEGFASCTRADAVRSHVRLDDPIAYTFRLE
jgi:TonB family protein